MHNHCTLQSPRVSLLLSISFKSLEKPKDQNGQFSDSGVSQRPTQKYKRSFRTKVYSLHHTTPYLSPLLPSSWVVFSSEDPLKIFLAHYTQAKLYFWSFYSPPFSVVISEEISSVRLSIIPSLLKFLSKIQCIILSDDKNFPKLVWWEPLLSVSCEILTCRHQFWLLPSFLAQIILTFLAPGLLPTSRPVQWRELKSKYFKMSSC